ncbi:MAG TPA: mechanosensitive ion channel domain-containing protein [Polyangiaceae bacterium]|nr:mechanosensitive ion channel domain-containing protein [Polyangiaceae bacterium]
MILLAAASVPVLTVESPLFERFVKQPAEQALAEVVRRAPTLGSALAVLFALWLVARAVRAVTARLLKMSKLDRLIEDTWFGRILSGLSDGFTPSKAIASLLYVAIMMMAVAASADILGLSAVRNALTSVLGYVPRLVSAICVLAVGGYVGRAARRAIGSVMKELKSPFAGIAESGSEGLILVLTVTVAVNALGADLSFVTNNLAMLVGTLVLTAAFLFAWSMRKPAEEIIANYYLRRLVQVGDKVTFGKVEGTVEKFAALGLVLKDAEGSEHFVPARHVLDGLQRAQSVASLRRK